MVTDPIEYLLYKKYPLFYTIKVYGQYNTTLTPQYKEVQKQIDAYRDELAAKPADEIQSLYNQAKEQEEREKLAYEEEQRLAEAAQKQKEQAEISKAINAPVDYEHWAKMPLWSLTEAMALSLNLSPHEWLNHKVGDYPDGIQLVREYRKLKELVTRAEEATHLADPVHPSKFLAWVKRHDIPFPDKLEKEIHRIHGTPIDWKAKYKKLQKEYDELAITVATTKKPKDLSTKERETLLKMIIGMAVSGYRYDPTAPKSSITTEIYDDLVSHGVGLDQDTIRSKLKDAAQFLPSDFNPKELSVPKKQKAKK
jgi:hypothetical protein